MQLSLPILLSLLAATTAANPLEALEARAAVGTKCTRGSVLTLPAPSSYPKGPNSLTRFQAARHMQAYQGLRDRHFLHRALSGRQVQFLLHSVFLQGHRVLLSLVLGFLFPDSPLPSFILLILYISPFPIHFFSSPNRLQFSLSYV